MHVCVLSFLGSVWLSLKSGWMILDSDSLGQHLVDWVDWVDWGLFFPSRTIRRRGVATITIR